MERVTQTGESAGFRFGQGNKKSISTPAHYPVNGVSRDTGKEKICIYIYKINKQQRSRGMHRDPLQNVAGTSLTASIREMRFVTLKAEP